MKILLLLPASPSASPYLRYYLDVFDKNNVDYDICIWNRSNDIIEEENYFVFNAKDTDNNPLVKIKAFDDYRKFIIKVLKKRQYDQIVVFTIQLAIYLYKTLLQHYKGKYIVDIRDYSKILKIPFIYNFLNKLLENSVLNCISSEGFKQWLPRNIKYTISHNISSRSIKSQVYTNTLSFSKPLKILTIGAIRDESSNILLIKQLGNSDDYILRFAGDGPAIPVLKNFSEQHQIHNICFSGRYNKTEEEDIVGECDMINILLPHSMIGDYLMSNRFYLSVINRKPMIVNSGCFQAKIVKQYNLGVVVNVNASIPEQIRNYRDSFNYNIYNEGCHQFMHNVSKDIYEFEASIKQIVCG